MWFVYILKCNDGLLYVGMTTTVEKRVRTHNLGLSSFTKSRIPVEVVYAEEHEDKFSVARREKELKGWRKEKKLRLIKTWS